MFKSRTKVMVILVCFSFLLLCSTLVFCSQTQNFGADVDVFYTAPKGSQFLTYELNSTGDGWVVTGYDESKRNGETALDIPEMHTQDGKSLPVTEIKEKAFSGKTIFTNLTIGKNILKIGQQSFYYCTGLTSINYNATSAEDMTRTTYTFSHTGASSGGVSVVIGNDVTKIPNYLFYCYSREDCCIISLTVGDHVETIGSYAFYQCDKFNTLTIPNNVKTIGGHAFDECRSLKSLTIEEGVTTIGGGAFNNCSGLTNNLTIPNSVTTIGSSAFSGCGGLSGLTLSNKLTKIGALAFDTCSGFTGNLTIPSSVTTIGRSAFDGCGGFTGPLIIPSSVKDLGESAFYDCTGFTSLVIKDGLTTIKTNTFQWCSGLTSVSIPSSITSIGTNDVWSAEFAYCKAINEVIIDSTTIYQKATFSECHGQLIYSLKTGGTIKVLQSADDGSNTYLNNTSNFSKSTTTINGKKYNVYTKK